MEDSWHQLSPKTGFEVRLADRLTEQSWQTLSQLYQPVIGPLAAGAFSGLFWLPQRDHLHRHAVLLATLGVDLAHFYDARVRLEATGLLTTTVTQASDLTTFTYTLHAPLLPAAFFNDDLLSVQLLDAVGEDFYQELVTQNTPAVAPTDGQDITKTFLDVFQVVGGELKQLPKAITASRQHLPATPTTPKLGAAPTDFDWQLLGQILEHSYVDATALQVHRQLFLTEHVTYGIDEPTMARFIGEATNLATNQFNAEQFKRLIAQQFGQQHRGQSATTAATPAATTPTAKTSQAERALIQVATATPPVNFLQAIKKQTGGFITDGEQRIVRDLVGRQLFPTSVLNLMIYHVLVDEDRPTLNKNLLDTIANDWSKAGIQTPAQAIAKIRDRQKAAQQPKSRRTGNRRNGGTPTVRETLPDWAKKPTTANPTPTGKPAQYTAQQKQELAERIARFKQRREGKEES
ncbi:replication initiation and membrane attachment family protein [Levilactobacillus acidifarinae]|uniref:Replication initiation membrane attachment protein n=1 Tax=Levilactobacillus acidifarinae DSM 19394 = JCM 15949 TaxID=1423715 RepID=A0A0R1LQD7_9LACO|nr:DnaD domain protein [Levilactobacillus acidifarinae]KRK94290.1 replication initiation membrane attachment protein [Levilactobacillus acidifarinae DSM 19394]GEO69935.1 helicase DnaB [Levilactobacillus acidifarinae]